MSIVRSPKDPWNPGRPERPLDECLNQKVKLWLDAKVKDLILDYAIIQEHFYEHGIGVGNLLDFSYLITPAFKALEGTLIQIAKGLGFDLEKHRYRVGVVFDEDRLERFYEDVLNKLETIGEEQKLDIRQWLNSARRLLSHMRHAPAHFQGERKESYTKAFQTGDAIIFTINEMCRSLLEAGVFDQIAARKMQTQESVAATS